MPMTTDVFISHSSSDKNIADVICHFLEARGIRCWIAPRDVPHGLKWADVLNDAISNTKLVVLVFTSGANDSDIVEREILLAVKRRIAVIPFRAEDVHPSKALEFFISAHHWLDAITPPIAQHIQTLADSIEGYLSGRYTPLPKYDPLKEIEAITERWVRSGYEYSLLEGINDHLRILIKHPNDDVVVDNHQMLMMLMVASLHFGGDWPSWVKKNWDNSEAVKQLIRAMDIAYFRPRLRALFALQSFLKHDILKAVNEMEEEMDPDIKILIETHVLNGTVHEYILKVRQGSDAELARKAAAVLKEISRYTGMYYGGGTTSGLPVV